MARWGTSRSFIMLNVVLLVCFSQGTVQGGGILRGNLGDGSGVSMGWRGRKRGWERNFREGAEMLKGMDCGCVVCMYPSLLLHESFSQIFVTSWCFWS